MTDNKPQMMFNFRFHFSKILPDVISKLNCADQQPHFTDSGSAPLATQRSKQFDPLWQPGQTA